MPLIKLNIRLERINLNIKETIYDKFIANIQDDVKIRDKTRRSTASTPVQYRVVSPS